MAAKHHDRKTGPEKDTFDESCTSPARLRGPVPASISTGARRSGRGWRTAAVVALCATGVATSVLLGGQDSHAQASVLEPLGAIPIPGPGNAELAGVVRDRAAAIALGKALFWDVKVGSDNKTACASCHFQAGADNRLTNQISPGLLTSVGDNTTFNIGLPSGVNYTLTEKDFPLAGALMNDVVSSQGVFNSNFKAIDANPSRPDQCDSVPDPVFHGLNTSGQWANTRKVEPRNSPTVINAVFNFRNFWDGRANNVFNGVDPFGLRNNMAVVYKTVNGIVQPVKFALPSSSLASQASGPPLSGFEMSCANRKFVDLGKKLLGQRILSSQTIAATDSVLGSMATNRPTYAMLVTRAFDPAFWASPAQVNLSPLDLSLARSMDLRPRPTPPRTTSIVSSQMESNFSLFFSLAIQMYEATLVSDDTPYDRYAKGNTTALTDQQKQGLNVFRSTGKCVGCHGGAEFTNASFRNVINQRLERMPFSDGSTAVYDNGFYNIGVRPPEEDPGVGGTDPFNHPLSETLMAQNKLTALLGNGFNSSVIPADGERVAVTGAFKTPTLRNVELTGPYFHNGGKATLAQVVDFYNRGGDFPDANRANLHPDIQPLGLSDEDKKALVAFLKALTDDRVRYKKAPFDHPGICIPNGHVGGTGSITQVSSTNAAEAADRPLLCLPAVGSAGTAALQPFLGLPQ